MAQSLGPPQLQGWDGLQPPLPNPFPSPPTPPDALPKSAPRSPRVRISISETDSRRCSSPSRVPWAVWATLGTRGTLGGCIHRATQRTSHGLGGRRDSEASAIPRGEGDLGVCRWGNALVPVGTSARCLAASPSGSPSWLRTGPPVPCCPSASSLQEGQLRGHAGVRLAYPDRSPRFRGAGQRKASV